MGSLVCVTLMVSSTSWHTQVSSAFGQRPSPPPGYLTGDDGPAVGGGEEGLGLQEARGAAGHLGRGRDDEAAGRVGQRPDVAADAVAAARAEGELGVAAVQGLDLAAGLDVLQEGHEPLLDAVQGLLLARLVVEVELVGDLAHGVHDLAGRVLGEDGGHELGLPLALGAAEGHVVEQPDGVVGGDGDRQRVVRPEVRQQIRQLGRGGRLGRQRLQQAQRRVLRDGGQVGLGARKAALLARLHLQQLRRPLLQRTAALVIVIVTVAVTVAIFVSRVRHGVFRDNGAPFL